MRRASILILVLLLGTAAGAAAQVNLIGVVRGSDHDPGAPPPDWRFYVSVFEGERTGETPLVEDLASHGELFVLDVQVNLPVTLVFRAPGYPTIEHYVERVESDHRIPDEVLNVPMALRQGSMPGGWGGSTWGDYATLDDYVCDQARIAETYGLQDHFLREFIRLEEALEEDAQARTYLDEFQTRSSYTTFFQGGRYRELQRAHVDPGGGVAQGVVRDEQVDPAVRSELFRSLVRSDPGAVQGVDLESWRSNPNHPLHWDAVWAQVVTAPEAERREWAVRLDSRDQDVAGAVIQGLIDTGGGSALDALAEIGARREAPDLMRQWALTGMVRVDPESGADRLGELVVRPQGGEVRLDALRALSNARSGREREAVERVEGRLEVGDRTVLANHRALEELQATTRAVSSPEKTVPRCTPG